MEKIKKVILLGATGSIGKTTIELLRNQKDKFKLIGVSANTNVSKLKEIVDEEKAVLGSSSFGKEPVTEEINDENSVAPKVEGIEETGDTPDMPTAEELIANPAKYLKELLKIKEAQLQTQEHEEISEDAPKAFSEQVKDVLAALNDLMVRATAIAMLRAKDGRKLGEKATEAIRAVQDDLQDAWVELDQFIDNVSDSAVVTEESVDVEEELPTEEPQDEPAEEPVVPVEDPEQEESTEEVEVESDPETEPVEVEDNTESVDEEAEALWLESQRAISDSLDAELEVEDNI